MFPSSTSSNQSFAWAPTCACMQKSPVCEYVYVHVCMHVHRHMYRHAATSVPCAVPRAVAFSQRWSRHAVEFGSCESSPFGTAPGLRGFRPHEADASAMIAKRPRIFRCPCCSSKSFFCNISLTTVLNDSCSLDSWPFLRDETGPRSRILRGCGIVER